MNERWSGRPAILAALAVVATIMAGACGDKAETSGQPDVREEAAAVGSPRWIVERFFSVDSFPEAGLYVTGSVKEMYEGSGSTFGGTLAPGVKTKARVLEGDTLQSTVAVEISDSATAFDIYCYLDRDTGGWKLSTLRSLAQTGVLWALVADIDTMTTVPDSMRFMYENCKLTVSSDAALKAYLLANLKQFNEIVSLMNSGDVFARVQHLSAAGSLDQIPRRVSERLEELHLASVEVDSTGRVEILVGGMTDNMVCFVHVPEGSTPPRIDRDSIIYAELVTGRWYLFKTT